MALHRRRSANGPIRRNEHGEQRWQIIYTGFILIMLCLFILLTSFASLDPSKVTQFVNSFSNAVGVLGGSRSTEKSQTFLPVQVDSLSKQDMTAHLFEQVQRFSEEEEALHQVQLFRNEQGVVMTLTDTLLFDSGKAELTPEADPIMKKIARLIERLKVPVEIGGHTDDLPIRTALFPSNWELSTARAVSVLRSLVEQHGVDADRLSAVGFAHYRPAAGNDAPLQRALNRRVEFIFLVE
jgi:chemotaxis protein MotB